VFQWLEQFTSALLVARSTKGSVANCWTTNHWTGLASFPGHTGLQKVAWSLLSLIIGLLITGLEDMPLNLKVTSGYD